MRRQRSDANQPALAALYRELGCSVEVVSMYLSVDLCVGCGEVNDWVEIKDGSKPPSKRKLSDDEQRFQDEWRGRPVVNVKNEDEVVAHVKRMRAESVEIQRARRWPLDHCS